MRKSVDSTGRARAFVIISLLVAPAALGFQKRDLKTIFSALENKILCLRQPARGTSLSFDANGRLIKANPGTKSLYGWLEVTRVQQKKQKILIGANRLVQVYDLKAKQFVQYRSGRLEIEVMPGNVDTATVETLIAKIFALGEKQEQHVEPDLTEQGVSPGREGELRTLSNGEQVYRVGANVKAPRVISAPDPEFNEEARKVRFNGAVSLWAVLDEKGAVKYVEIIKPAGYGLEAQAIDAVSTWRFEAATLDGRPVPVAMVVDVMFRTD